jgi:hypothetical protein
MKKPEEIKKWLKQDCGECDEENFCPYMGIAGCIGILHKDALAYIQQLEADLKQEKADHQHTYECAEVFQKENAELLEKIKQLEQERDAALRDIAIICETCLYNKPKYDGFKVRNECHNPEGCHYAAGLLCGWVWRGVCEENGGKDTNAPT